MKYCLSSLIRFTKRRNKILVVIGHSTKSGLIAGLLTLQHMVDAVFFMRIEEGDLRSFFSKKNRFGQAQVSWQAYMTEKGFAEKPGAVILKLDYEKIKEVFKKSRINGAIVNSDMKWLFKKAFGENGGLTNIDKYDILYGVSN